MAKGVLRGSIWGLVLGGAGVVSASLIATQPAGNTPPARPQLDVAETEAVPTPDVTAPQATQQVDQTEAVSAPVVATPQQEVTTPIADSAPLALPETPDIGVALEMPIAPEAPALALADEEPVLPNPQSIAPQVPANEGDLIIETAPATPVEVEDPIPPVVTEEVLLVETPAAVAPTETQAATDADPAEVVDTSQDNVGALAGAVVVAPNNVAEPAETAQRAPATTVDVSQDVAAPETAEDVPEAAVDIVAEVPADVPDTAPAEVPTPTVPEVVTALPEEPPVDATPEPGGADAPVVVSIIDAPTTTLPQGAGGVKVNRVGVSQPIAEDPAPEATPEPVPADGPALDVFAAEFENSEGKPLMSFVLIDDNTFAEAPRALAEVPFPVTVLIDPAAPNAAARMQAFRDVGIEVGVGLSLPQGARPVDVEVALEASFATLPQTVVLADVGGADRVATGQMIAALTDSGRGFVSLSSGLSSGLRAADAAGVPAVEIFRDLDGDGQDARVIRRFLDQAAFRARQNSGVVVLGRMRADTLSALILWGTANRAGQVALAPVSALMRDDPS